MTKLDIYTVHQQNGNMTLSKHSLLKLNFSHVLFNIILCKKCAFSTIFYYILLKNGLFWTWRPKGQTLPIFPTRPW